MWQAILDFLDDLGAVTSFFAVPGSEERHIMYAIEDNPTTDVNKLIREFKGWIKPNRKRLLDYKALYETPAT